jgi:hypothetical protein
LSARSVVHLLHGRPGVTEEHTPGAGVGLAFAGLVNDLREGIGDDLREVKEELRTEIKDSEARVSVKVDTALLAHAEDHEKEAAEHRESSATFREFIQKAQLDAARRDGVLGVVRFGFELVSAHGGAVVKVALAAAALLGVLSGSIRVAVGG